MSERLQDALNTPERGFIVPPGQIPGWDGPVRRLHLNESPIPASPKAVAAMTAAAAESHRYPDGEAVALRSALSERTGHPFEQIMLGTGSHELILTVGRLALDPSASIVAPAPTFYAHHRIATLSGAALITVPVRADGSCDAEAMLAAIRPDTRVVSLVTPNNPTGTLSPAADVALLAREVPDSTLLLVDEAYFEFGMAAGGPDVLAILQERGGPWLLLRTFSKAYGLAGCRIGYGLSSTVGLTHALNTERGTFQINGVALAGASAALDDEQWMKDTITAVAEQRERLAAGMRELGFDPGNSATNFISAKTPIPASEVAAAFAAQGTLIVAAADGTIRITIGTAEDVDHCLTVLGALVDRLRS